jgi:guanosine-3',5'-bis(diphosphate) 3'-pyrophosphohydrolase
MLRFNDIADRLLEYQSGADLELLQRAYVFTAKVHDGQERLSGEPYLIHPLEVAGLLVDMRVDDLTVAAALLHDTLEDTLTTREEIERLFGDRVAFIVDGLTKIAKIEFTSARERQAENFRKMLLAMSKDIRILLIKLADRLHNMRTLKYVNDETRRRVAQETVDIYVPLAHRLGIYWMKQELEDLAFRALKPHIVEDLERQLVISREERERYIEEVIGTLSEKLAQAGLKAEVTGRLKDLASIHAKMESQGISLDQVYDVIAFRIILDGPPEQTYTALGAVHGTWRPVPARFKDYVALPKPNGYQSLHTTAIGPYGERMEVQIRTAEMHRDAEFGIAAHWKYKEGRIGGDTEDERKFAWLRQLLEWQGELADPHEFLDAVKVDLFPDEVFVFTPRGEVINLPRGATPVDFAYAIHSQVGAQCAGAKVNGKLVTLKQPLVDGDTVEITTNPGQMPRKDWLDFVVSSKARNRIRHDIRQTERARARSLGRDILGRELRKTNLSLQRLEEDGELAELARRESRGSIDELYCAVSYGKLSAAALAKVLRGDAEEEKEQEPSRADRLRSLFRRQKSSSLSPGIRVSGLPDVLVRFGGCCDPVSGDDVTGFVTRGRGVTVHARDCPRALDLDPERRIEVSWDDETVPRRARIRVSSKDQPGILAKITNSISTSGINIGGATITTGQGGDAVHHFELWVDDLETLSRVMKGIEKVKGVISVERVRG